MVEKLEPPEKWAHLRWHWIQFPCGTEPEPTFWSDGEWTSDDQEFSPEHVAKLGWRYHGPDDPNAITLDPADEGLVERLTREGCGASDIHLACSFPDCTCRHIPNAVKAVIAEIMKGRGK